MPLRVVFFLAIQLVVLGTSAQSVYLRQRDSILHAPKMQAVLRRNSTEGDEEHFIRKNHVMIKIDTGGGYSDSSFYNYWGAITRLVTYKGSELWNVFHYDYDEFGELVRYEQTTYYKGTLLNKYYHHYYYAVQAGGMEEQLVRVIDSCLWYRKDYVWKIEIDSTLLEYEKNRLTRQKHWNAEGRCHNGLTQSVTLTTFEYDSNGNCIRETSYRDDACGDELNSIKTHTYDKHNNRTGTLTEENGIAAEEFEVEYNSDHQQSYYRHKVLRDGYEFTSSRKFLGNGLIASKTVTSWYTTNVHSVVYIYYPKR